jgi:phosphocarrier protein
MSEARETVEIVNAKGLHARASAKFVNMVAMLPGGLDVKVVKDGPKRAAGRSWA